jgi:predicted alpha/beta-fold hydrolase
VANSASIFIPLKPTIPHEHVQIKADSEVGGLVTYEVMRHPIASNKVLFVVPGMSCSIKENHLNQTCVQAFKRGYNVVVVNPVSPDYYCNDLEMIDYGQDIGIGQSVTHIKGMFGQNADIYAVGFSLGSNHLMRHLGSHKDCGETCGIKAAVSISGAFDLLSSSLTLKNRLFGVYDDYMKGRL